ncbi:MAG: ABC transporter ATP-binding protein [Pseudomonadota bacterium]
MSLSMLLNVQSLTKAFPGEAGPVSVLDTVDLSLGVGETVALTGESGSGKSTLLHVVAGLEPADSGLIVLAGRDLGSLDDDGRAALRREALGIVFQQFNLIPSLNVAQNIAFQARLAGREDESWAAELTERLGLAEHSRKFPEELSGGQQQRVAIGRALAPRPALILADEPTGNLDEATADGVLDLILELTGETGAALLLVTHSARLAGRLSRKLTLSHGRIAP